MEGGFSGQGINIHSFSYEQKQYLETNVLFENGTHIYT